MKNCSKCKTAKMFTEFSRNHKNKDGLQGWCRSCINAARRQPAELLAEKKEASLASRPFSKKTPINCVHCGAFFYRKGRGGKEKHCSEKCRFWSKVAIVENGRDCWPWLGARKPSGYGNVRINKKYYSPHRVAFEIAVAEIPDNLIVMHLCDNPPCCNPSHLVLGTIKANSFDMIKKNRQGFHKNRATGVKNPNAKLNPKAVREIRQKYGTGNWLQKGLACEYGVAPPTIRSVINNETWKEEK